MNKQYEVTFTYRGYVAGVFYNNSTDVKSAIESARWYMSNKWTGVTAKLVSDDDDDEES